MTKFNIYDELNHCYIKKECKLLAAIEPYHVLTDDEVRKYFGINEDHKHWERAHHPARVTRYVFDKIIIPDNPRYRWDPVYMIGNRL